MNKDHYAGQRQYRDYDGHDKSFTVIDHDRNTSRLKLGRESKEGSIVEDTSYQKLVKAIYSSEICNDNAFIEGFDGWFSKKYQFERFKKGRHIEDLDRVSQENLDKGWEKDLEKLFKKALTKKIKQLKDIKHGLQK